MESILFKGVEMVLPEGIREGDLLVKNGKIAKIDWSIDAPAETIIKEKGLTLMPGAIDTHVHFREPGAEHKEDLNSGSKAAAAGGVTSFFDMPNNRPTTTTASEIAKKKQLASEKSLVNYNFYIGATDSNLEVCNTVENVPAIKIFVGSSTGSLLVDDPEILEAFFATGSRPIAVHSEDEFMVRENMERYKGSTDVKDHMKIRSVEAALASTRQLLALSEKYQRRLHILHLTTSDEISYIANAKAKAPVTTEVCIQHLLLSAPQVYDRLGTFAQINPPLRDKFHADSLWQGLKQGVISSVVTDHAPHLIQEKQQEFGKAPSGMPGVETLLPLLLTLEAKGKCHLSDIVNWVSTNPAKLFNIRNKGALREGYDADLVLVDRQSKWIVENKKVYSKCQWSAFEGWEMHGKPIATFVHGQPAFREGSFMSETRGREILID